MKIYILIALTLLVGVITYGQHINTSYTYESINGLDQEELKAELEFDDMIFAEAENKKHVKIKDKVLVTKIKEEVLVRYVGEYSDIKLVDNKGNSVGANYIEDYNGFIISSSAKSKSYFLEVTGKRNKTYYHKVSL